MTLHFAYGSNMARAPMGRRCPTARALGPAMLDGWRFIITVDGYASVVRAPGRAVHGVVWELGPRDLAALNSYESLDSGLYRRVLLNVRRGGGSERALVYVGRARGAGRPVPAYMEGVIAAARDWRLPACYIAELARWAPAGAAGRYRRAVMSEVIRRLVIRGRVQGVGYRAWVEDTAHAKGLAGWVRNRRDGSVEAVIAGSEAQITDMVTACYRGPSAARVTQIETHEADAQALGQRVPGERFSVLATV